MEEKNSRSKHTPGLPEAINPEIGNGVFWTHDPHQINLRSSDPTLPLDDLMFDTETYKSIVDKWSGNLDNEDGNAVVNETHVQDSLPTVSIKVKTKTGKKLKKVHSLSKKKTPRPDWLQNESEELEPHHESNLEEITPEMIEKPRDTPVEDKPVDQKEGKRVRKVVKKVSEDAKKSLAAKTAYPTRVESSLSPFTQWLKGLRGSEYVHPYDDDYALGHMSDSTKDGISETFADLLAAQGFKDQALDMYKLLMAKYPEKSSFFAAKIEALK